MDPVAHVLLDTSITECLRVSYVRITSIIAQDATAKMFVCNATLAFLSSTVHANARTAQQDHTS